MKDLDQFIITCESLIIPNHITYKNSISDFLNKEYSIEDDIATESVNYLDRKYPIYVVLIHSGTLLANIIQRSTGHEFSHACISFNKSLNPLYSFGRKKVDMKETGFVINYPKHEFFRKFKTKYSVYQLLVTKDELIKMKNRMKFFEKNADIFKYDIPGLVYNFIGIEREKSDKYVCSRFVADIINSGIGLDKNPSLYKPNEFKDMNNIILLDSGDDFYIYKIKK